MPWIGGWEWLGVLLTAAFWILLIAIAVWLLRSELPNFRMRRRTPALDLLEERYARGEIGREEFFERRGVLLREPARPAPSAPAGPVAPPPPPEPPPDEPPPAATLPPADVPDDAPTTEIAPDGDDDTTRSEDDPQGDGVARDATRPLNRPDAS